MMRGRKKEIKWSGTFGFKLWQRVLIFAILSLKTNDKRKKKTDFASNFRSYHDIFSEQVNVSHVQ